MELYNAYPNFSILMGNECDVNCLFCFWKPTKEEKFRAKNYLEKLEETIMNLLLEFYQVSLTGAEPTLFPLFEDILEIIKKLKNLQKWF